MIKNILAKISLAMFMAVCAIPVIGPHFAHAAADADLLAMKASSTAYFTDNKSTIIGLIVAVMGGVVLIIVLAKGGMRWLVRVAGGIFGGGKRRR